MTGRRRQPEDDSRPTHDEAIRNVRSFYANARKTLGVARPTMQQYAGVAKEISNAQDTQRREQEERERQEQVKARLMALGKAAGATTAGLGLLAIASRDYARAVVGRAEELRMFDARIGLAAARYKVGELVRTYRTARDVGGTTAALLDARRQRMDAWQPITSQMENLGNTGRIIWTRVQGQIGRFLDNIGVDEAMEKIVAKLNDMFDLALDLKNQGGENQPMFKAWLRAQGRIPFNRPPEEM